MSLDARISYVDGEIHYYNGRTVLHYVNICSYHNNYNLHKFILNNIPEYKETKEWYCTPVEIPRELLNKIPMEYLTDNYFPEDFHVDNLFEILRRDDIKFFYDADW